VNLVAVTFRETEAKKTRRKERKRSTLPANKVKKKTNQKTGKVTPTYSTKGNALMTKTKVMAGVPKGKKLNGPKTR